MPPVLGPVSPSPTRLKSCAGNSGTTVCTVDDAEQRYFGAVEKGLQQHRMPVLEQPGGVRTRDDRGPPSPPRPCPRPDRSSLTTQAGSPAGGPNRSSAASNFAGLSTISLLAVRTPAASMTSLAKALEPSMRAASAAGPEADDAGSAHGVGHPEHQRHLGTDDHQVGRDLASQRDDVVAGGDVDVVLLGDSGGARVAGSNDYAP